MPKIKKFDFEEEDEEFTTIIKAQIIRQGIGTQESLARRVGSCKATTVNKINHPKALTVRELRKYVKHLDIKPAELLDLIYGKEKAPEIFGTLNQKTTTLNYTTQEEKQQQ